MPFNETKICNMALGKLGVPEISSYDNDTSVNANRCRLYYPLELDSILRSYPWNCSLDRKHYLAADAATPAFTDDYTYQYILPVNPWCLRPLRLEGDYEYRIEGRKLLCNVAPIDLHFIKRITDTTDFDPLLVKVLVYSLAAELSPVIHQNKKLPIDIVNFMRDVWLPMAKNANGMESFNETTEAQTTHRLIDYDDYV